MLLCDSVHLRVLVNTALIRTCIHTYVHTPTHACTICTQSSVSTCVVPVHGREEYCTEYCVPSYYSLIYADKRHCMKPDMSIYILCTVSVYLSHSRPLFLPSFYCADVIVWQK